MKVKIRYEKTQHLTAETEVDDAELLEYVNNGGDYDFTELATARTDLGGEFFDLLLEFITDHDPDSQESFWTNVQDAGPAVVEPDHVEEL